MSLQAGQILDNKYRIIRELGTGAMGAVYEGENIRIARRVAIKVLLPGVAQHRDTVQRFEREAQAAGRIGSEHIVEVLDLGTMHDGGFYMVMEFLEGMTLGQRIRSRGRLDPRETVPVVQQLLSGLEAAHQAKIIHRDLKPDNVFLVREHAGQYDFVKILDFGVSKFNPLNAEEGMSMTRTGAVVGTPFYMAPEQAKGARDIDSRSDLYSVGVILYEAITGQVPFHAGTFNELIFKIVLEAPPPPETYVPNLHPAFSRIVKRAMAREASERFQTAAEFRDALSLWLHTGRDSAESQPMMPPPASDLDYDDDLPTQAHGNLEPRTRVMQPEDVNLHTQLMAEGAQLIEPKTKITTTPLKAVPEPPPSKRRMPPPSRRRKPPPSRRSAPAAPPAVQPAMQPAMQPQPPAVMIAPQPAPAFTQPMPAQALQAPGVPRNLGLTPSPIARNAPTPVPPPMDDEEMWPIAGVPAPQRKKPNMVAVVLGVMVALAVGAGAGFILLRAPTDESEATAEASQGETPAEETTASSETQDGESQASETTANPGETEQETDGGEQDGGEETVAANDTASAKAPPPPPPPPPVIRPRPRPRPQPAVKPAPVPAPAPRGKKRKAKKPGRKINTEL